MGFQYYINHNCNKILSKPFFLETTKRKKATHKNVLVQFLASSTLSRRNLKTASSLWKHICFWSTQKRQKRLNTSSSMCKITVYCHHFGITFEDLGRKIKWLSWCHHFQKVLFSKCFSSTLQHKAGVLKFIQSENILKSSVFDGQFFQISEDGRSNIKKVVSNFSSVVWLGPNLVKTPLSVTYTLQTVYKL